MAIASRYCGRFRLPFVRGIRSTSHHRRSKRYQSENTDLKMLYTIAVVLIILWLLGFVTGAVMGQFIHILLVVAIVLVLVSLISGRRK
jgi:cation transporter-like permease